jgi:hypothetical protein
MKKVKAQHDSAWKSILEIYLPQALELCFPELYELIDWDREWIFLDKELESITTSGETGKRFLDKLARAYLKNGETTWVLLHFEIELKPTQAFPERMFIYGIRLYDKFRKPIASCALLADTSQFRTTFYETSLAGSRMRHDFLTCKLIDFEKKRNELEVSTNPFAAVILFHLDALAAKKQPQEERLLTKISLTKRLYDKGFQKEEIINIFRFLDFSIALNEEFELQYQEEILKIEENKPMAYILSPFELLSMKKGREQTCEEIALRLLERGYPDDEIILITKLTKEKLQKLREKLLH